LAAAHRWRSPHKAVAVFGSDLAPVERKACTESADHRLQRTACSPLRRALKRTPKLRKLLTELLA